MPDGSPAGEPADEIFEDDVRKDPIGVRSQGDRLKRLLFALLGRWHWVVPGLALGILFGRYQVSKPAGCCPPRLSDADFGETLVDPGSVIAATWR